MNGFWWWLVVALLALLPLLWLRRVGLRNCEADWGNTITNSLDGLNRLLCKRYHRFRHGEIELPQKGGAILASNHVSGLDPLLLSCACSQPLRYMIAKEQYNKPLLRWLYKDMGSIPVDRDGAPEKAFYAARKALHEGALIAVYPQGRIVLPHEKVALKRGVILLADLAQVPIIPLRLSGIAGVGRVLTAPFIRSRARLEVGAPIRVTGPKDKRALAELGAFITGQPATDNPAWVERV